MPACSSGCKPPRTEAVALMLTRRCNMSCGHCSVESHPRLATGPELEELKSHLQSCVDCGVPFVLLTGGEPMLRQEVVFELLAFARSKGLAVGLYSNGFWGKKPEVARELVNRLKAGGLLSLALSYDRFHADHQSVEPLRNIARAAAEVDLPVRVSFTRGLDEEGLAPALEELRSIPGVLFRFYDLQPVGAARKLAEKQFRAEWQGACNACGFLAITEDARVTACNGPSYFQTEPSPLALGSLKEEGLASKLERFHSDPYLTALRTMGPARMLDMVRHIPDLQPIDWPESFQGMCQACHFLSEQPRVVQALRTHLSQGPEAARLQALSRLQEGARRGGALDLQFINRAGGVRATLELHRDQAAVLGRADLDWTRWVERCLENGLSLWAEQHRQQLQRWAPQWALDQIQQHARASAVRHLILKEALHEVALAAEWLQLKVVVLKGGSRLFGASGQPPQIPGDLDLYVESASAEKLRNYLLAHGFQGPSQSRCGASHHLAPIYWKGIPLEIHHRLMPTFWGLPEAEMLNHLVPLELHDARLWTLSPEGELLLTMVHCSKHLYSHGLKAGWALRQLLASGCDGQVLARWVARLPYPRSFWIPWLHFRELLDLDNPDGLIPPTRSWQDRYLWEIASRRLYSRADCVESVNPFLRLGFYALLAPSAPRALSMLPRLVGGDSAAHPTAWRESLKRFHPARLRQQWNEAWQALQILRRRG